MKRTRTSLVVALLAGALLALVPTAASATGNFTRYTDTALDYWLYEPSGYGTSDMPLVVYLHGCTQDGPDIAAGTLWNEAADAESFLVVYPEQVSGLIAPATQGNFNDCWNFHSPNHQQRGSGEPALIMEVVNRVRANWNVDDDRIYVVGASAGAGMAVVMAATYPDVFAAQAVLAGCPYAACSDTTGAHARQAMGAQARAVPTMVVHGTADEVTVYPLGEAVAQEWLGVADLDDDGLLNGSVSRNPASTTNHGFNQQPQPFSGEHCVAWGPPDRFPCLGGIIGFPDSYPYTIRRWNDAAGDVVVEFWALHGAGHGYVGGDMNGSFTDPLGPDITSGVWRFFQTHSL